MTRLNPDYDGAHRTTFLKCKESHCHECRNLEKLSRASNMIVSSHVNEAKILVYELLYGSNGCDSLSSSLRLPSNTDRRSKKPSDLATCRKNWASFAVFWCFLSMSRYHSEIQCTLKHRSNCLSVKKWRSEGVKTWRRKDLRKWRSEPQNNVEDPKRKEHLTLVGHIYRIHKYQYCFDSRQIIHQATLEGRFLDEFIEAFCKVLGSLVSGGIEFDWPVFVITQRNEILIPRKTSPSWPFPSNYGFTWKWDISKFGGNIRSFVTG